MSILNFKGPKRGDKTLGIKNLSKTEAEIAIYGTIDGSGWYEDSISSKDILNALKAMGDSVKKVHVRINSPGGSVFEGIAIHSLLKNSNKEIITYCDGIAASIASIIFMAGEKRYIATGATVMIHKPMSGVWGNTKDLMEMIDRLDMVEDQLVAIYKKRTNLDDFELRDYIAKETFFDSEESINYGFATEEMPDDVYVNMAACLENAVWIRDRKAIIDKYASHRSKIDNAIKEFEELL